MEKSLAELFNQAVLIVPFGIRQYLHENLVTGFQNARLNILYKTLHGNITPNTTPIAWGGKVDDHILGHYIHTIQKKIIFHPSFKTTEKNAKELDKLLNLYQEYCRKKIENTAAIQLFVKYLPFEQMFIQFQPRIVWPPQNPEKMILVSEGYTLGAELLAQIPRAILIGKTKKESIKIVPIPKPIDLPGYSLMRDSKKSSKDTPSLFEFPCCDADFHHRFVDFIMHPLLTELLKQNSTNAFAEHLNADPELYSVLEAIKTPIDSDHTKEKVSIIAMIQMMNKSTIVLLYDYQYLCFEGILKSVNVLCQLGATCYTFPGTRIIRKNKKSDFSSKVLKSSNTNKISTNQIKESESETIELEKMQKLEVWTQSELDNLATKRGIVNLPTWTEQELHELALQRGIIKLDEWTEEELDKQAKSSQSSEITFQPWMPDSDLIACQKCDYLLQPDWDQCPICGTPRSNPLKSPEKAEISKSQNPTSSNGKNEEVWHPPADNDKK